MNYRNRKPRYQSKLPSIWLALTLICSISQAQSGFESLFNGKDLSGWEGQDELWKIEPRSINSRRKALALVILPAKVVFSFGLN